MSLGGEATLFDLTSAAGLAAELRATNRRLVFTNGVFDLLHAGHVAYLYEARRLGDFLLVGLNADASVRQIKGPSRPLVSERDRAAMLLALRPVDGIVVFAEPTASAVISAIKPDIYVKGGDYALAGAATGTPLPEEPAVLAYGGEIRFIPYRPGYSTSALIARIREAR